MRLLYTLHKFVKSSLKSVSQFTAKEHFQEHEFSRTNKREIETIKIRPKLAYSSSISLESLREQCVLVLGTRSIGWHTTINR